MAAFVFLRGQLFATWFCGVNGWTEDPKIGTEQLLLPIDSPMYILIQVPVFILIFLIQTDGFHILPIHLFDKHSISVRLKASAKTSLIPGIVKIVVFLSRRFTFLKILNFVYLNRVWFQSVFYIIYLRAWKNLDVCGGSRKFIITYIYFFHSPVHCIIFSIHWIFLYIYFSPLFADFLTIFCYKSFFHIQFQLTNKIFKKKKRIK